MRSGILTALLARDVFKPRLCEHSQYSSFRKRVKSQNENNVLQGVSPIANLHQQH